MTHPVCTSPTQISTHFSEVREILTVLATRQVESEQQHDQLTKSVTELASVAKTFSNELSSLRDSTVSLVEAAQKMGDHMTAFEGRLAALEKGRDKVSRPSEEDVKRFIIHYLMRVGMDTRLGYMCACPVMVGTACYVVISLGMLSTSFMKLLPAQRVAGVRNLEKFKRAFDTVPNQAETRRSAIQAARKILAIKPSPVNPREMSKWVAIPAEEFLCICRDTLADVAQEAWTGMETIRTRNVSFPPSSCFDSSSVEDFEEESRTRMAWKHAAWEDILLLDGMVEYRRLMAHHRNVDMVSEPTHFSAYEVFEDEGVKRHPRAPRRGGKRRMRVAVDAHDAKLAALTSRTSANDSLFSDSGSCSDSGSDSGSCSDSGSDSGSCSDSGEPLQKRQKQGSLDDLCNPGGFN